MEIKSIKGLIKSKVFSGYVITFGVEFLIALISIILFKIISVKFLSIGFAEYTVNKRLVGFLMPLLMIGLGVSLPKFLPTQNEKKQLETHYTALILVTILFLIFLLFLFLLSPYFSKLVFGDVNHEKMCFATLFYVYSSMVHACVYNFFRGKFNFKTSSLLQLINIGIIPLLTYFVATSIFQYFLLLGGFTLSLLLIVNLFYIPLLKLSVADFVSCAKKLINYGIQRMPGDVVLGLFFAVPTFIASNYFSLTIAGNIAFCLSMFNIIIAFMSPINIILLPEASKMVYEKNFTLLRSLSTKLLLLSISLGVFSFAVVFFFGRQLLIMFNIKDFNETSGYLSIVFLGVIGYSVFSVIRSVIDAYYEKARTTVVIVVAFLFFLGFEVIAKGLNLFTIQNTLIGFSLSINLLGILTYLSIIKIYKVASS